MIAGEFDLSVASVYSLCPLVMASLWVPHGVNVLAALGIALLLAVAIGVLNGLATLMLGIPSFIITLATALFWAESASTSPAAIQSHTSETRR